MKKFTKIRIIHMKQKETLSPYFMRRLKHHVLKKYVYTQHFDQTSGEVLLHFFN